MGHIFSFPGAVLYLILLLVINGQSSILYARMGKAFFSGDNWIKGDIRFHNDSSGKEFLIITNDSGVTFVPRSEIKTIVYTPVRAVTDKRFHRALKNTFVKRSSVKAPKLYEPYIRAASKKNQLDPALVKAVIKQESNFKRGNTSHKGAQGLMQLMPGTARSMGVQDAFDPWENIHGGARYLRLMLERFDGNLVKALAAYNAGPRAVQKYGAIPPYKETQSYVKNVLRYYESYRGNKLFSFRSKQGGLVITDQPYLK